MAMADGEMQKIIGITTDNGKNNSRYLTSKDVSDLAHEVLEEIKKDPKGMKVSVNLATMWKIMTILDFLTEYKLIVLEE